jgi:predicted lipoprotein with Yx(FWY)xxD motif
MPKLTRRTLLLIALVIVVASLVPTVASAVSLTGPQTVTGAKPAIVLKTGNLGKVLATPARFGIYYWTVEKKAGGKIRCTGPCAVAWPPVYVKGTVQRHVKGVAASFGTIKRGTKRQLTINGLPAYTYHHDPAGVVLCDNVNGWFAVRPL